MSNQLLTLLDAWHRQKDETEWVLGTIIGTLGSSYRKAGAMMLFNGLGQQYGLLSGGCLEADLLKHAQHVITTQKSKIVTYDMHNEDDIAWQLGIGCGGVIRIQLSLINAHNNYLQLQKLHQNLIQRIACWYLLPFLQDDSPTTVLSESEVQGTIFANNLPPLEKCKQSTHLGKNNHAYLAIPIHPVPHLVIFGGGVDARPVVTFAHELGWKITLIDHRTAYARKAYFPHASHIFRHEAEQYADITTIDAAIVMTHNIKMDARALSVLVKSSTRYIALLGAIDRKKKVFTQASINEAELPVKLSSPAGLDLGGELPESIALSILAECHATLEQRSAQPLSGLTPKDSNPNQQVNSD